MKKITIALLFFVFYFEVLHARYLNRSDFPFIIKEYDRKIIVNKDGTREITTKIRLKIKKEAGRKRLAIYPIVYNNALSKITIVNAAVINGKKKQKVAKTNIVDKPMAKKNYGFDSANIIKIALPNLKVGSIVEIEYKEDAKET
ncbi:MAG: DUF3857 domain-containing protein, partial [Halobacteriovoraceae bacterium]|nr:DUF3857 domain-containing protein [Halobacteriovoraceae bacterium]